MQGQKRDGPPPGPRSTLAFGTESHQTVGAIKVEKNDEAGEELDHLADPPPGENGQAPQLFLSLRDLTLDLVAEGFPKTQPQGQGDH